MAVIVDDAAFDVAILDAYAIGLTDVAPEANDVSIAYKRIGHRWVLCSLNTRVTASAYLLMASAHVADRRI